MLSSATTRDREDESLSLPTATATGHDDGSDHNEFQYHKFFPFVGRPFTSLHLRSILTVGGLILLVFPLVLNLRTGESLLYQSQIGQSSLTVPADVDGDVGKIKESSASATADSNGSAASEQCLNLDLNQDMDSLIASARQVFITMPAKAGGTSMQAFANKCVDRYRLLEKEPNILNPGRFNKEVLISNLHAPPIVASHLYNSDSLIRLSKYPSRETLMIHIHREETSRIISAVKQVLNAGCGKNPHQLRLNVKKNGTECILEEGQVVDAIASRTAEIGVAEHDLLNCKSYKALQENGPQLVVINYKQVDKLQALLAKHHCPQVELPVHANIAEEKSTNVFLKLQTGGVVNIKDWLREKGPSLGVALNLRQGASCQAKTFHMEDELFGCPDEALQITTESIKRW